MAKKSNKKSKKSVISKVLGNLDIVFIIDATGSMMAYIEEARRHAKDILKRMEVDKDLNIRVALIGYRDHPPQDSTFVTKIFDFDTADNFHTSLNSLDASGGGDRPEAVWDGIDALFGLEWREQSDRIAYLIGDSPPHGNAMGDGFPNGCPCGLTAETLVKSLKEFKVELNGHSIANHLDTTTAFELVVLPTGGKVTVGDRPESMTTAYTTSLGGHSTMVESSRVVMNAVSTGLTYDAAAGSLGWTEEQALKTKDYLNKRGISPDGS